MKNKKLRIANYAIAVCNILMAALFYPSLPEKIPMNWSSRGTVSYSEKYQLFFMCGLAVLLAFLMDVTPKIDPRKKNYEKFGSYYDGFCVFMQVFLLLMTGVILVESYFPGTLSVPMLVMVAVGILFMLIGNIMPKVKSNFFMGIRTPWALSSDEVWRKTNRLGGKCFFIAGLLMIVSVFFLSETFAFWLTMVCVAIVVLVPTIMSYVWWKQEQQ